MKSRYEHIQTILTNIGSDGCYFLSLLSIAEEYLNSKILNSKIDLIDALYKALSNNYIDGTYFVKDALRLLEALTNVRWSLSYDKKSKYEVDVYFNKRTGYKHFRRPEFDTLLNSVTVKEGAIIEKRFFVPEV